MEAWRAWSIEKFTVNYETFIREIARIHRKLRRTYPDISFWTVSQIKRNFTYLSITTENLETTRYATFVMEELYGQASAGLEIKDRKRRGCLFYHHERIPHKERSHYLFLLAQWALCIATLYRLTHDRTSMETWKETALLNYRQHILYLHRDNDILVREIGRANPQFIRPATGEQTHPELSREGEDFLSRVLKQKEQVFLRGVRILD